MSPKTREHVYWEIAPVLIKRKQWTIAPDAEYADWTWYQRVALRGDVKLRKWSKLGPVFTYSKMPEAGPYDVPHAVDFELVVSERLRNFLRKEAVSELQFYPIRIKGPGSDRLPKYFAVRFLNAWDCLHPYAWDEDENGRFVAFPVIDPAKIPRDQHIGVVKNFSVQCMVSDHLKRRIVKARFTGLDLSQKAAVYTNTNAVAFTHVNKPRDPYGPNSGGLPVRKRAGRGNPRPKR